MKTKILLITAILLTSFGSFAQDETDEKNMASDTTSATDTTKISFGETKILILTPQTEDPDSGNIDANWNVGEDCEDGDTHRHWAGIDVGVNGLLNSNDGLKMPEEVNFLELDYGKSIYASFNFWEKDFEIVEDRVRLLTGLGLDWNSYAFKRNVTLSPDSTFVTASFDSLKYDRNKLRVTSLTLPVMFGFNTHDERSKSFRFAAGVVGKYSFNIKTKQRYELGDVKYRPTVKDDYHVRPFTANAMVRMGYGPLNLYASYGLLSLFEDSKSPELVPFTVGATVLMF